ncbi:MAG TPA: hypothetical protein VNW06_11035 [Cytophagaceae bacterium]|jgi:hypothetical protein|nr:hypothetical protein [Cytophagaceae bacterium]
MRILTAILYFLLAIVLLASLGVLLSYLFEGATHSAITLYQNIIIYYIAIFSSAALDMFLKITDNVEDPARKTKILSLILLCIIVLGGSGYLLYLNLCSNCGHILEWLIGGVTVSYIMWWLTHYDDDAFSPTSTLGGNPNKSLKNG